MLPSTTKHRSTRWLAALGIVTSILIAPSAFGALPGVPATKTADKTTEAPNLEALTPQWWQFLQKSPPAELSSRGDKLLAQLQTSSQKLEITENLQPGVQQALRRYVQMVSAPANADIAPLPETARSDFEVMKAVLQRYSAELAEQHLIDQQRKLQRIREATLQSRLDRNWQQYRGNSLTPAEKLEVASRIISTRLLKEAEALSSVQARNRSQQLHDHIAADRRRWQKAVKQLGSEPLTSTTLAELTANEPALQRRAQYANRDLANAEMQSLAQSDSAALSIETGNGASKSASDQAVTAALQNSLIASATWRRNEAEQLLLAKVGGQLEKTVGREQLENLRGAISLLRERAELLPQTGDATLLPIITALETADAWQQAAQLKVAPPRFGLRLQSIWTQVSEKLSATLFRISDVPVTALMLFRALILFMVGLFISAAVRRGLVKLGEGSGFNTTTLYTLSRLSHYIIVIVALLMALASIGLNFGNIALVAGALSVGIGFGLQAIVSNFVSGLILLLDRSLKVGDYIELDSGLSGTVKEIRVRSTVVTSNDNVDVLVPNSEFVNGRVMNWTYGDNSRRLHVEFNTAYGSDKKALRDAVIAMVPTVPFALRSGSNQPGAPVFYPVDKAPAVWFLGYGDSCMNFELVVWINATGIARPSTVKAAFRWGIDEALIKAGITIPHRQRNIMLQQNPDNSNSTASGIRSKID